MANVYDEGTRLDYLRHRNFCDEKSARIISELVQFMDEVGNLREQMTAAWLAREASEAALRTLRQASQRVMQSKPFDPNLNYAKGKWTVLNVRSEDVKALAAALAAEGGK